MVTGVETAGLILAVFPLVIEGIKFYLKGLETIKRWWRYVKVLEHLVRRLDLERVKFHNTCEELLCVIADTRELQVLLEDPGGPHWREDQLLDSLREHLGRSFGSYMGAVTDMRTMLEKLVKKLELDNQGRPQWIDCKIYKREWKRVRLSLVEAENEELLKEIGRNNRDLGELLGHRRRMAALRTPRLSKTAKTYKKFRASAGSLHKALLNNLTQDCDCPISHTANLQIESLSGLSILQSLEEKRQTQNLSLGVLFSFDTDLAKTPDLPWYWRETAIESMSPTVSGDSSNCVPDPEILQSGSSATLETKETVRHLGEGLSVRSVLKARFKRVSFQQSDPPSAIMAVSPTSIIRTTQPSPAPGLSDRIGSLCKLLRKTPDTSDCLGILESKSDGLHRVILSETYPLSRATAMVSLNTLFTQQIKLERKFRLTMAVKLTATLLQLQDTPWLNEIWGKQDILFLGHQEEVQSTMLQHSFVSTQFRQMQHFLNSPASSKPTSTFFAKVRNQSVFALGIVLIELWYGRALGDLGATSNIQEPDADPEHNEMAEFTIAKGLLEEIYREAGEWYGDAVRRCIFCEFDQRDTSLETNKMTDAVHQGVYMPLFEHLKAFCGGTIEAAF